MAIRSLSLFSLFYKCLRKTHILGGRLKSSSKSHPKVFMLLAQLHVKTRIWFFAPVVSLPTSHKFPPIPLDKPAEVMGFLIRDLLGYACTAFCLCFHETSGEALHVAIRFSAKGAFPRSQADLMPRGAERTISGIFRLWELGVKGSDFIVLA